FDAPIETMFEMWTKPEHFSKWLAPTGFNMEFLRADIKAGGESFYCMSNQSVKTYGRAKYLEVRPHDRIVYTQQFVDEDENISRHPAAPTWPETMITTVTLAAEGPNCTRVTVAWECHGPTTAAELETFIKS